MSKDKKQIEPSEDEEFVLALLQEYIFVDSPSSLALKELQRFSKLIAKNPDWMSARTN